MAKSFTPSLPYSTAIELLKPSYTSSKGVEKKTFTASGVRLNCSWKSYGGTETPTNGAYTVIDTANVETWYRPDIKADCRIKLLSSGKVYEIIGEPENIDQRNQFLKCKVQAVKGGA